MQLAEGLDTGGIYARQEVPIGPEETSAELRKSLVEVGTALLVDALSEPVGQWIADAEPQAGEVTYASKFEHDDFEIDWSNSPEEVHRLVRVGGAWTTFRDKRLKILQANLVEGRLVPETVQPEGKTAMSFESWRNGAHPVGDELFGNS
jgi:methionyl-tRNA formyltransferase